MTTYMIGEHQVALDSPRCRKTWHWLVLFIAVGLSGVGDLHAAESPARTADQATEQGRRLETTGAFAQAAIHWMEAARLYEQERNTAKQSQALTHLAYALQQDGQVRQANATLQVALRLSEQSGDRLQTALILGRMGNTAFALGQADVAVEHLKKSLDIVRGAKQPAIEAALLNDLGNAQMLTGQRLEAADVYTTSRTLATQTAQPALALTALINIAMAFLENGQYVEAQQKLDLAFEEVRALDESYSKAYGYLTIGLGYTDLRTAVTSPKLMAEVERQFASNTRGLTVGAGATAKPVPPGPPAPSTKPSVKPLVPASSAPSSNSLGRQAMHSFQQAADIAGRLGDSRAEAYALGYLGSLLEKDGRYADALTLTRKAVFAAQKVEASDSLYQWHWQTARLLKATGNADGALSAYQRAVSILKPIRFEYSVGYQGRHHSFQDSVAPLFREFEDVLLRRAASSQNAQNTQQLLVQVRDAAEASRIAEIQDYYRDDCVTNARNRRGASGMLPGDTAVIYPIMLPDRLELLVETSDGLQRVGVPIGADQLTREARDFRRLIQDRRSNTYLSSAQKMYSWLLAPLQSEFSSRRIQTVVFVPDGPLRSIPIAALHDGKRFAIERYYLAVTPSMELTDTQSADLSKTSLLSMGLTEAVQGFPPLPNVATEVSTLKNLYGGKLLLDNQFVVPALEQEIKGKDVSVVHIASHGQWEPEASKSFLLAYDDKISMNRLSQLVGLLEYRVAPLELLTLSACETAVGDDRAALGLAGVAIKAGARSALATLWFVDDQATSELVAEFYRQLRTHPMTKAEALQQAQLMVKRMPGHEHPSFWAPFLLISNWM